MRFLLLLILFLFPLTAQAGQAEAKELARSYNCQVSAITPVTLTTGSDESITYKVDCVLPETSSADDKAANSTLMIKCTGALCEILKKGSPT